VNLDRKLLKYDTTGNLINTFTAPGSFPIALTYDGQYLWSLDFADKRAYQFDITGRVIKSIPAPTRASFAPLLTMIPIRFIRKSLYHG
jgi:hypothetical protein